MTDKNFHILSQARNDLGLTLRKICQILDMDVPEKYTDAADTPISTVTIGSDYAKPGSVCFCNRPTKPQIQHCVTAVHRGATHVFSASEIYDGDNALPTILTADPGMAAAKVGRYIHRSYPGKTVCVTGSAGKSTTTQMIFSVLQAYYNTASSATTVNANDRVCIMQIIQGLSAEHQMYVQEVGGSFVDHIRSSAYMLEPDVSVITNIGRSHIDGYGSFENVRKDKLSLARQTKKDGLVLLNIDDAELRHAKQEFPNALSYGVNSKDADYYAENIFQDVSGLQLDVVEKSTGTRTHLKVDILGIHNAYNAVAAFAVGRWAQLSPDQIAQGLQSYHPRGIRQAMHHIGGCHVYTDCYSTVDLSMILAMDLLSSLSVQPGSKKIAVLWEMQRLDSKMEEVYRRIADAIKDLDIDTFYLFGNDAKVLADFLDEGSVPVRHTADWNMMCQWIRDAVRPGDIVFFKGQHQQSITLAIDRIFGTVFSIESADDQVNHSTRLTHDFWHLRITHNAAAYICGRGASPIDVTVPDFVQNKPVIHFGRAVYANSKLRSIKMGRHVSGIGTGAFENCTRLIQVDLGKNLRRIGVRAFSGATALREIVIPVGCIHIDSQAFANCTSLERVFIPDSVKYIAPDAFDGCPKVKLYSRIPK